LVKAIPGVIMADIWMKLGRWLREGTAWQQVEEEKAEA
jgi:hypothetical protein